MAATTEPPPLDDTNLLDDEPGPTPTMTPTSPSPPPPAEEQYILSDDPVTEDLESPFEDPADLMKPVALDDGFEPISLSSEPSAALPENREVTSPSLISPTLMNGDHQPAAFVAAPAPATTNGGGAFGDDDDDDDDDEDLFSPSKLPNNQAPVISSLDDIYCNCLLVVG